MKKYLLLGLMVLSLSCFSQNRNSVWCFGDSALIDFSDTSNIITGTSMVKSRGSCVTMADSVGNLLYYAQTRAGLAGNTTQVFNSNHALMQFGDSIVGEGWYREIVTITYPGSDSLFYVFSIGVTGSSQKGLFYSVIDMSANAGLGQVIQKNIQLQNFKQVDCLTAIKHGNGRDWWIFFRKSDYPSTTNNNYYSYLISPQGILSQSIQSIGLQNSTNLGKISFSNLGDKMMFANLMGLMEVFDFDRCTGLLSNPQTIYPEQVVPFTRCFWSVIFAPSDNLFYATTIPLNQPDTSRLLQYDLTSANIAASADTLWETSFTNQMGELKLAADGKIYLTTNYLGGFPYNDTTYNTINTNLSIINSPDNLSTACNLQPYGFYLGGKRSYVGLPNNPNYDLGPLIGSGCDTLTNVSLSPLIKEASINAYYHPSWQTLFVNAQNIKGKSCLLQIFDMNGRCVFTFHDKAVNSYFTHDVLLQTTANGIYMLKLTTEKETLTSKFVKQ